MLIADIMHPTHSVSRDVNVAFTSAWSVIGVHSFLEINSLHGCWSKRSLEHLVLRSRMNMRGRLGRRPVPGVPRKSAKKGHTTTPNPARRHLATTMSRSTLSKAPLISLKYTAVLHLRCSAHISPSTMQLLPSRNHYMNMLF